MCDFKGVNEDVSYGRVWTMVLGYGRMCLGFSLGSMAVYMLRSHLRLVSKFWGGGWSEIKNGLCRFLECISNSCFNLFVVIVFMYVPLLSNSRVLCSYMCMVGFVVCISLYGFHS